MTPDGATARDAGDAEAPPLAARPVGDRWAVIVGISDYEDDRLTLRYADRDATALREFLLTPAGGAYATERIELLLDREATVANVTRAIRTFLSGTREDDLVLLFFACHGAADATGARQPLYLLTADADYDDIANTALPMDQIDWCLRNYVRAERVVILADTCHSAGIDSGARGEDLSAAALNVYLEELSRSSPGIAYLTSARAAQRSYEDRRWGGGHGAFTHFLLEGLKGAADGHGGRPRDNLITLQELAGYVRDRVFEATQRRQEPILGQGPYDPELPLAWVGGLDVEAKLRLARAMMQVGWLLADPAPFECAAREAAAAAELANLAGAPMPEAAALEGEALLAARRPGGGAAEALARARTRFGDALPPMARLHEGLALTGAGDYAAAAERLAEFAALAPEDPEAGWAAEYASWLRRSGGRERALLIGVGSFASAMIGHLPSPRNDIALMQELLSDELGIDEVVALVDEAATRPAIIAAFERLAAESGPDDTVLVYFSGHGTDDPEPDRFYLVSYDAPDGDPTGISAAELHRLVGSVPARARLVLLDTHGNAVFNAAMAHEPVATVLVASAPGVMAYDDSSGGRAHGAFTAALVASWRAAPDRRAVSWDTLREATEERLRGRFDQTPVLLGATAGDVLHGRFPAGGLWRHSRARAGRPAPPRAVVAGSDRGWPRGERLVGRDLLADGHPGEALGYLEASAADDDPVSWLDTARAAARAGRPDAAEAALRRYGALEPAARWDAPVAPALGAVTALREARPRALLIGIGRHADGGVPPVTGARNDVAAVRADLLARGFDDRDLTVLEDGAATRERILAEAAALAAVSGDALGVLYVAANGSRADGRPSIVPYDGRGGGAADVALADLPLAAAANLVTIVDAGCGHTTARPGARTAPAALPATTLTASRDLTAAAEPESDLPAVGGALLLAELGAPRGDPPPLREHGAKGTRRGILTEELLAAVLGGGSRTYATWPRYAPTPFGVVVHGAARDAPALAHHVRLAKLEATIDELERAPAVAAAGIARQETVRAGERNEPCPVAWLELGLATAAAGRPAEAIRYLRAARNQYGDDEIRAAEKRRDPYVQVWRREAHYHLGRLLHEHSDSAEDLADAVASLSRAREQTPQDPRYLLHLGLAIRAQAERQNLVEARRLLRAYVDAGAPLGRLEDIRAFLAQGPD